MENILSTNSNQKMSSREIAEITGKQHRSVLRDIDTLNDNYEKLGLHKIVQGFYTHPNTGLQQHREMLLNKIQTMDLMTGYSIELRIKVNRRWEQLEKNKAQNNISIPQSFSEALKLAYEQALKIEEQEKQLEEQAPKVLFTDAVVGSKSSCLVGDLAKIITQNGVKIGQNRLFQYLREKGYLGTKGERRNMPNQAAVEKGLFEIKIGTRTGNDGELITIKTAKVTGRGQVYFINKFLKNKERIQKLWN